VFQPVLNHLKLQSGKPFLKALNDNIQRFEKAHCEIRDYEKARTPLNFGPTGQAFG
jgi:hypothetical protein